MGGKRVLIVDDSRELSRMLLAALQTLDSSLSIKTIPSAEEALLELAQQPLDLLVTDVRLPGMSGLDLVSRLHSRSFKTKILVLTHLAGDDLPERARAAGADWFLRKPLHMNDFLTVAAQLLGLQPQAESKFTAAKPEVTVPPETDLTGALIKLRNSLGAALVLLASDTGKVLVQVGEHTGLDFEGQWAPAIMAALSASHKAGRLINPGLPQGATVLRGANHNLMLAPIGNFALVVLLTADASGLRTAITLEEVLASQKQLVEMLDKIGAPFRPIEVAQSPAQLQQMMAESEAPPEKSTKRATAELKEIQQRLKHSEKDLDKQQTDEFWEKGLEDIHPVLEQPDVLSFDEARQLGLTPEND